MARIRNSDIETLKSRANIADIVGDYVTLKRAGVDSMKGLCPFHDERTPSFHVRPNGGYFHCFGCGESGDAIAFVQKLDHLSFTEAVERLAQRIGMELTYEDSGPEQHRGPRKSRLYEAHTHATEFYRMQLESDEGSFAREFMAGRGFDAAALEKFGVGYSPKDWSTLTNYLQKKGFTPEELTVAGLSGQGNRGLYDRFRGRVMWPIRDTSGQTIGFGARKLYDDDQGPKYLNTSETPIYHKAQALYGIDQAKRAISKSKRAIVVEGYTDVMACHLAGVEQAIATSGTAFGPDHIAVLRRVLGDDHTAEVIFTFDPDAAGQAAALRAFGEERRFQAQTYVAVAPEGLDPSDLRQHRGDEAVRQLFEQKQPLFAYALMQAVHKYDLNSVEGRALALRDAAPIVAGIRDAAMRPGYIRELAGLLGEDLNVVRGAVHEALKHPQKDPYAVLTSNGQDQTHHPGRQQSLPGVGSTGEQSHSESVRPRLRLANMPRNSVTNLERDSLMAMLQAPEAIGEELMSQVITAQIKTEPFSVILQAIAANQPASGGPAWIEQVVHTVPDELADLVRELVVAPLPARNEDEVARFAKQVVIRLLDRDFGDLKTELLGRMQRLGDTDPERKRQMNAQISALESARRALRAQVE